MAQRRMVRNVVEFLWLLLDVIINNRNIEIYNETKSYTLQNSGDGKQGLMH